MLRNRACDQCAARKTKCDRKSPCQRCSVLNLSCTIQREYSKPGPKGPWAKKKRGDAGSQNSPPKEETDGTATDTPYIPRHLDENRTNDNISAGDVQHYLRVYSRELYPFWPVIDVEDLINRLQHDADLAAYALSTALSAVVLERLAQLGRMIEHIEDPSGESEKLAAESENVREKLHYQLKPSIDILLSSFFLHIHHANRGQICKATLLLREAITFAQFFGFDQASHYATLPEDKAQIHLRILWILYITERYVVSDFLSPKPSK